MRRPPRSLPWLLVLTLGAWLVPLSSCLQAWPVGGPWACSVTEGQQPQDGTCPANFVCDDGLCCNPDDALGCPTLPTTGNGCRVGTAELYYEDRDGDGDGNDKVSRYLCKAPLAGGLVKSRGDCDDTDPKVNTRAVEVCNGRNDNCDLAGELDEGAGLTRTAWYRDQDGDGYGAESPQTPALLACAAPPGYVARKGDCQPFEPARYPDAPEQCNNIDDDCDGKADPDETDFADVDVGSSARFPCTSAAKGVCAAGTFRCVGTGPVVRTCVSNTPVPATFDRCDGLDNDCDGMVDERPDCTGPDGFLGPNLNRQARYAASLTVTQQNTGCLKDLMTPTTGWSEATKAWSGTQTGFQLLTIEAPGTTTWDLTRQGLKLRLKFTVDAGGATAFGAPGNFRHPVIYLCGDQPGELIRYVPITSLQLINGAMAFDSTFVLSGETSWIVGRGSGFDTAKVRRVEVLLSTFSSSFALTLDPLSGFVR